jgi:hypothetical protein
MTQNSQTTQITQTGGRFCRACYHINPSKSAVCEKCGAQLPLNTDTLDLADEYNKEAAARRLGNVVKVDVPLQHVALHIIGQPAPLIVEASKTCVLGRAVAGSPIDPSLIDLAQYSAAVLGVSRKHAKLHWRNDHYELEDCGGMNGSWINGTRIESGKSVTLPNNAEVRLGKLRMTFYYSESK